MFVLLVPRLWRGTFDLFVEGTKNSGVEDIFQEISQKTGARLLWEVGCKSPPVRKEPCIKIIGSEDSIQKAKDMLLDKMEMQSNRVVLKMDITHFEHPPLIGKGGMLIKKVMEATGCHIHFPDTNLCERVEKSNQVSIYGEPGNAERARTMLRALIPVQMLFEVPVSSPYYMVLKATEESQLLENFNGFCIYSAVTPKGPVIIFRCNQDQFPDLRKDMLTWMEFISCKNGANLPPVQMRIQIAHHHQIYVRGNNNSNVERIMKRTGAKIMFPVMNSARSDRSTVKIIGNIDCVFVAWQEIMSYLPVLVSFDVISTRETTGEYLNSLKDCGITVYSHPKTKYYIKNVTVKGPEKYSQQMLQYRQHILRLPSINFRSDIEDINLASKFLASLNQYFHSSTSNAIPPSITALANVNDETNQPKATYCPPWMKIGLSSQNQQFSRLNTNNCYGVNMKTLFKTQSSTADVNERNEFYLQSDSVPLISPQLHNQVKALLAKHASMEDNNAMNCDLEMTAGLSSSPNQMNDQKDLPETHNLLMEENKFDSSFSEIDYYRKKAEAAKAMRRPIESMESAQVPSSLWAGYGFSQSMPAQVVKARFDCANQYSYFQFNNDGNSSLSSHESEVWENSFSKDSMDGNIWSERKETNYSQSNYFDFLRNTPFHEISVGSEKDILPHILCENGLHKYIDLFAREEVNYKIFTMLNDHDLAGLGISYQARRKLLCLIRELNDSKNYSFSKTFDAAPGAERKLMHT